MAEKVTFEAGLSRLEKIVEMLERGQLSLEEAIARFEEGVTLAARCSEMLKEADLQVRRLVKRAQGAFDLEEWEVGPTEGGERKDGQES